MTFIKWKKEFCTGIPDVDYEHEQLIEQINSVFELIDQHTNTESIVDCLGDIYGSISAHFALEEQMMKKHGYDQYTEHSTDHERLLDDIRDLTDEFESTSRINDDKFKLQLNSWFLGHFQTHDARLHRLSEMMTHQSVDEGTLQRMIQKAKKALLNRAT